MIPLIWKNTFLNIGWMTADGKPKQSKVLPYLGFLNVLFEYLTACLNAPPNKISFLFL